MQVPDQIRKCVGYVGVATSPGSDPKPGGTFFLVGVPAGPHGTFLYAVTAAHVIDGAQRDGGDLNVHLRVNLRTGGVTWLSSLVLDWRFHPTKAGVDVAVLPLPPAVLAAADLLSVPMTMAATPEVLAARGLSHGDEVFYTGLFTKHVPATRNIPIVRIGNIAALPEEPITWRRERAGGPELVTMDPPYLVETRSIGGLSGSPVFVNFSGVRTQGRSVSMVAGPQPFYLLGLMHGHWDIAPSREWAATVHEDSLRGGDGQHGHRDCGPHRLNSRGARPAHPQELEGGLRGSDCRGPPDDRLDRADGRSTTTGRPHYGTIVTLGLRTSHGYSSPALPPWRWQCTRTD